MVGLYEYGWNTYLRQANAIPDAVVCQIRDIRNVISDFGQVSCRGELSDEAHVSLAFDVRSIEFNVTTTIIAGGSLTR